ncbi:MAG: sugar phosphate nucleotidyltransferase [bacterium]
MKYAIIPAAGLATRFLPASKAIPKELFPILDKPAVQYIVEEAVSAGISSVVFVSGSGKEAILDHFDKINPKFNLSKLSEEIKNKINSLDSMIDVFSVRQKEPLGLGHAVFKGVQMTKNDPFAVLLPDMLLVPKKGVSSMKKMIEIHKSTGFSVIALMKVPEEMKGSYGIAEVKECENNIFEIKKLFEKPSKGETSSNLAIVGRYVFSPAIAEILENSSPGKNGEIQLTDAIVELLKKEKVLGVVIDDDTLVFDTGNVEGFVLANSYLAVKREPEMAEKIASFICDSDKRPWGYWISLEKKENYQVKRIYIYPNEKLSLQKHKFRSETWTVVGGSGFITIGEKVFKAEAGQTFQIEKGEIHRAEAEGKGLEIIEVQKGEYLGEDDIERIEDKYGRE